ncbi:zinc finger protein 91 [Aplysia californica]|uniref:Zinc finger protein 91 n=1 Tax=Aplysia californica TaxID=6500 RepID=A0ABM0JIW0_APLCA|nr:zinc finger protein 91 [Aplysia californica]XP_005094686.1 zinc finger protein 91 [Aplysia californica]XP_012935900.1 zinc finger protein 91 [Aplysia californica]
MRKKTMNEKKIEKEFCKTNCVICWTALGSKKQLLRGSKSYKHEVKKKLQLLLSSEDFNSLYDEKLFSEPRLCLPCFSTIKKIPQNVMELQKIIGKPINTNLYKKKKKDSVRSGEKDACSQMNSLKPLTNSETEIHDQLISLKKKVKTDMEEASSVSATGDWDNDCESVGQHVSTGIAISLPRDVSLDKKMKKAVKIPCGKKLTHRKCTKRNSSLLEAGAGLSTGTEREVCDNRSLCHGEAQDKGSVRTTRRLTRQAVMSNFKRDAPEDTTDHFSLGKRKNVRTVQSCKVVSHQNHHRSVLSCSANLTRKIKDITFSSNGDDVDSLTEMKDTLFDKIPLVQSSEADFDEEAEKDTSSFPIVAEGTSDSFVQPYVCEMNGRKTRLRSKESKQEKKDSKHFQNINIPTHLNKQSKKKLQELSQKVAKYMETRDNLSPMLMLQCSERDCNEKYPLWRHLSLHIKYFHHNGQPLPKDEFSQKMSVLAGEPVDESIYPFKCEYDGCSVRFSAKEKCQAHQSCHNTDISHVCGYPDCGKAFRTLANLQIHHRIHTADRPYLCSVEGCDKSFIHKNDLSMHQRRHMGDKPHKCDFDGCDKAFTTSSELNGHKLTHSKDALYCCDVCGKQYCSQKGLRDHKFKMHGIGKPGRYKCPYEGCAEMFHKKEMYEIHLCTHSSEQLLCCEKCGKRFGCQRYLDVHYKVHKKNEQHALNPPKRTVICEKEGCEKKFTSRLLMKRHVISVHHGRKPRPLPGVFYKCKVEGCGRQFSMRSTLSRHDKLVHKGGDYRHNRVVVRYSCSEKGCTKQFNRKNLLAEHLTMVHKKVPKRLLPVQCKELDFVERLCEHCGMALSASQLPRHQRVYHSVTNKGNMKEEAPFPCHFKGCEEKFDTLTDRQAHVVSHKDNPPYKCEVEDCQEAFYLLKNLDNHLWKHCRKPSMCDFEGCSRTFEDQLLLAKHSKVHYDGRMLCSWRNCGIFFSSMGTLKQHLIAHSRSLKASFGSDFMCNLCDRVFSSKHGLNRHMALHDSQATVPLEDSAFVCEESGCHQRFSLEKDFNDHFLQHYTSMSTTCKYRDCQKIFPTQLLMAKHGKFHYGGKYKCPWETCDSLFTNFHFLKRHLMRHVISIPAMDALRSWVCAKCNMTFKLDSNLASHMKKHVEKSEYVCPECGKKFRHNHLKRHMLIHKKEKAHVCKHCGVRYGTVNGLRFHILKIHNIGTWPFKCNFCSKGFISGSELRRHMPSHTKEKPYPCKQCGAQFATHTGLKGHMRKHSGQKFVCDVEGCGKVYTTPLSLRGHKAQHEGFSKTCEHCGKTFRNPYGHKCKASKEARKQGTDTQGQGEIPVVTACPSSDPQPAVSTPSSLSVPQPHLPQYQAAAAMKLLPPLPTPPPPPPHQDLSVQISKPPPPPSLPQPLSHSLLLPHHHHVDLSSSSLSLPLAPPPPSLPPLSVPPTTQIVLQQPHHQTLLHSPLQLPRPPTQAGIRSGTHPERMPQNNTRAVIPQNTRTQDPAQHAVLLQAAVIQGQQNQHIPTNMTRSVTMEIASDYNFSSSSYSVSWEDQSGMS